MPGYGKGSKRYGSDTQIFSSSNPQPSKDSAIAIIRQINAFYEGQSTWQINVAYHLYKDHASNEIVESDSAMVVRQREASWFKMGDVDAPY